MGLRTQKPQLLDAQRQEILDDSIVVAIDSFATGANHEYRITRGTRLRATHPAVACAPSLFVADGVSDDELAALTNALVRWD